MPLAGILLLTHPPNVPDPVPVPFPAPFPTPCLPPGDSGANAGLIAPILPAVEPGAECPFVLVFPYVSEPLPEVGENAADPGRGGNPDKPDMVDIPDILPVRLGGDRGVCA